MALPVGAPNIRADEVEFHRIAEAISKLSNVGLQYYAMFFLCFLDVVITALIVHSY